METLDSWPQTEAQQQTAPESSMILVMGVTGAGKSYFVNRLKESAVQEGHDLRACTKSCEAVEIPIGDSVVTVVDTPGFDDDAETDGETLGDWRAYPLSQILPLIACPAKISRFMTTQYQLSIALKGIIYLHRITDNRFSGSARRYLEIFQKLCGDQAFPNVALVTTIWSDVSFSKGLRTEQQLRNSFWDHMISGGSCVYQFNGTSAMADTIVGQLLTRDDIVLTIQKELVDQHQRLEETGAGSVLASILDEELNQSLLEIDGLEQLLERKDQQVGRNRDQQLLIDKSISYRRRRQDREQLRLRTGEETASLIEDEKKKSKWKDRIQTFAAVIGLVINVTTNIILPFLGVSI